jgi:hypothetical protein
MRSLFVVPAMLLAVGSVAHRQAAVFAAMDSPIPGPVDSSVTVPAGAHIFAQLQRPLETRSAKIGDSVYMQVTFPVTVDDKVLIPAGTYILATLDSVSRRSWIHHRIAFRFRITSLLFANGYVAMVRQPAHAQPRDPSSLGPAEQPTALMVASGAAPVAGLAIGALADGRNGAVLGSEIGSGVGLAIAIVALTRGSDYSLAPGFPLELRSEGPMMLDAKRAADAVRVPFAVQSHQLSAQQRCYTPGSPGTPDIYIPGTPGMPPIGDSPGTPDTAPTIIPGTAPTPGYWHSCP